MADRIRHYTRGVTLFSLIIGAICTVFCLNVTCNQNYQKSGLVVIRVLYPPLKPCYTDCIQFSTSNLDKRGIPLSVPALPPAIPAVNVPTPVSGAITSLETAIGSIVPQNCSLGMKYFCIGFTDSVDCRALPLTLSSIIPSSITAIENSSGLDQALSQVTPQRIKDCLVAGAIFAGLATALLNCSLVFWAGGIFFPLVLSGMCSVICFILLLVPTIILYGLCLKAKLPKEISLETGEATHQILASLIFAQLLGASVVFRWLLDRYGKLLY